jgi:hypothetical protein
MISDHLRNIKHKIELDMTETKKAIQTEEQLIELCSNAKVPYESSIIELTDRLEAVTSDQEEYDQLMGYDPVEAITQFAKYLFPLQKEALYEAKHL